MDQYVDALIKGILHDFILVWPLWVFLALLFAGAILVGLVRRLLAPRRLATLLHRGSRTIEHDIKVPPQTHWRCARCGAFLSPRVRDYCLARPERFNGQVFCFWHQRTRRL